MKKSKASAIGLAIVTTYGEDSHVQFVACMCGCGMPMVGVHAPEVFLIKQRGMAAEMRRRQAMGLGAPTGRGAQSPILGTAKS